MAILKCGASHRRRSDGKKKNGRRLQTQAHKDWVIKARSYAKAGRILERLEDKESLTQGNDAAWMHLFEKIRHRWLEMLCEGRDCLQSGWGNCCLVSG